MMIATTPKTISSQLSTSPPLKNAWSVFVKQSSKDSMHCSSNESKTAVSLRGTITSLLSILDLNLYVALKAIRIAAVTMKKGNSV